MDVLGNSRQATSTQSKNIFDPKKAIVCTIGNWWTTVIPTQTNNTSVTIDENNILHGTASTYLVVVVPFKFEEGKTIYNKTLNLGNPLIVYDDTGKTVITPSSNSYTPEETFKGYIGVRINVDMNVDNIKLMFSYDENAEFEKFTPNSPTPEYPSEVECCGDNVNIFDVENFITLYSNATITSKIPNGIRATQNIVGANLFSTIYIDNLNKLSGKKMTLSFDIKTLSNRARIYVGIGNSDATIRSIIKDTGDIYENGRYYLTFLVPNADSTYNTLFFAVYSTGFSSGAINNYVDYTNIKLEEGEVTTPHSKYGQGNISFEMCNKNMFSTTNMENAYIDNTGQYINNAFNAMTPLLKVELNKISVRFNTTVLAINIVEYDENKNFIKRYGGMNNISEYTTNLSSNCSYVRFGFTYDNATPITKEFADSLDIQLEEGELTDYEPHKSQTYTIPTQKPFRKIDTYKDIFVKKSGKWYERRYIARKIFDGTEGLYDFRTWGDCYRIFITITGAKIYSSNFGNGQLCSHFKYDNNGTFGINENTKDGVFAQYKDTSQFYFVTDKTSAEDFKTFLQEKYNAGTPVYIDYVLSEPKDIECTVEQTEILDKIENEAKTYKRVTHIYSTDEISPVFEGTYNKDIEAMINNIATTVAEREE